MVKFLRLAHLSLTHAMHERPRVPIKMNRRTKNERFCVWQGLSGAPAWGTRSKPSEDGRWSLTPSRRRISRLNAELCC